MPSRQKHRGQHPKDKELFSHEHWKNLGAAVVDLSYLRSRNYGEVSTLKMVGDRYSLQRRQRYALNRIVSPEASIRRILKNHVNTAAIRNTNIHVDGFNILILAEVLHSNGFVFECLDGTFRDIASVHGSYHPVEETRRAISGVGKIITALDPAKVRWYLDSPVSNSGKLRQLIVKIAEQQNWAWDVVLATNPDQQLSDIKDDVVLSSDREILAHCGKWFNFSRYLIESEEFICQNVIRLKDLGINLRDFDL